MKAEVNENRYIYFGSRHFFFFRTGAGPWPGEHSTIIRKNGVELWLGGVV